MANNVMGNSIGVPVAVGLKKLLPGLEYLGNAAKNIGSEGNGGSGSESMKYFIRNGNPGEVTKGSALGNTDTLVDEVVLRVSQMNTGYTLNDIEILKSADSEEILVKSPKIAYLAKKISRAMYEAGLASCGVIISGKLNLGNLSLGDSYVDNIGFSDDQYRMFSPAFLSIMTDGSGYYKSNDSKGAKLFEGLLENFNGLDTIEVKSIHALHLDINKSYVLAEALKDGAEELVLTVTAGTKIEAGTPFVVSGLNICDIHGEDLGMLRPFIAEQTVTATGTTLKVPIMTLKIAGKTHTINDDGKKKDVAWAVPNAIEVGTIGTTANIAVEQSGLYCTGFTTCTDAAQWKADPLSDDIDAVYKENIKLEGFLPIRLSGGYDTKLGKNTRRMDVLFGAKTCNIGGVAFYHLLKADS